MEVYGYLNHGSENHLRAFNRQLERSENAYTPSYISKERFDAIILENKEGGNCTSGKTNCHSGNKNVAATKTIKHVQHRIVKKSVTKAKIHPAKKINPVKKVLQITLTTVYLIFTSGVSSFYVTIFIL